MRGQRDRCTDLRLVARELHPVRAQVAVHPDVPVDGLPVALEHQRGQPGVGPEVRRTPHVHLGMLGSPGRCLVVDAVQEHAGEQEERGDDDGARPQQPQPLQYVGHPGGGHRDEARLDHAQAAPVGEQPSDLPQVRAGVRIARPASDQRDSELLRIGIVGRVPDPVGRDVQHSRLDAQVPGQPEPDSRVPGPGPRDRCGSVVLEVPGGEQHQWHADDLRRALGDQGVDSVVHGGRGELEEAEPDRVRGDRPDRLGQRPELLHPVGVPAAVADDEHRPAHGALLIGPPHRPSRGPRATARRARPPTPAGRRRCR